MEKAKIKKIGNVLVNVVLYVFLAICLCSVVLTLFSKKDSDGAAEVFGYQMRVVTSESMAKCDETDVSKYDIKSIPIRSLIVVEVVPEDDKAAEEWYKQLKVGDVLTFRYLYGHQVTITHRIVGITEKSTGGYIIELAGDNKNADDGQLYQTIDTSDEYSPNYVIGKVTGQAHVLGVVMSFLMQPVGMILVVILPCAIIMLFEILKIARLLGENKRNKKREEIEEATRVKEEEIAELRRRLAELENKDNNDGWEEDDASSEEGQYEEMDEKNGGDE